VNRRSLLACSALLTTALELVACQGRRGQSSAPLTAASAGNSGSNLVKTFRLTPTGGVGFDDLWFVPELHAVLAPAGGRGCVHLFDSGSLTQTKLCGIGPGGDYAGGHGEGTTSADVGAGLLFAIDRSSQSLKIVDLRSKSVVSTAPLEAEPDYVRWVAAKREVWVTEPDREQIEVFSLGSDNPAKLARVGAIAVKGGPESLVIDSAHDRAFSHLWEGRTVRIALGARTVSPGFSNGCKGSRGIALDAQRGQLFVGCAEGKVVVLDVDHENAALASNDTPAGVDIISVNLALHHLYVPSAADGTVTAFGVGTHGEISRLGVFQAQKGTHCVASDDQHQVWVCAPESGSLLLYKDAFAPTEG
jgi:hypothetical protein